MTSPRVADAVQDSQGRPLSDLCGKPMETGLFLRLALGISGALAGLHQRDIIHHNVNPQNILVDPETLAVTLAGAAPDAAPQQFQLPERQVAPAYMSPEQTGRMNRSVDYRTDLYSLGVTFYQMLTGTLPCQAHDILEWVHCHIARAPRPPTECTPGISPMLSDIAMRLLAKNPEERYQTASGLILDLQRCREQWDANRQIQTFTLGEGDLADRLLIPQNLYGRGQDITTLLGAFERLVRSGTPELVMVAGPPGIGKTALVQELARPVVRERGFFISGKFDSLKRDIPYATVTEALRDLIRQILTDSEQGIAGWRQRLQEALGSNGQLIVEVIPEVGLILGPQPEVATLPPDKAQKRFDLVFGRFIGVLAAQKHPLVLFLDDLQWVDSASLGLLEQIVTHPDTRYLLLVGAYRDNEVEGSHPLRAALEQLRRSGAPVQTIALAPLPVADLSRLIGDAFHCDRARGATLTGLIHEKTAGNPFFVIQFLLELHGEGLVRFDRDERAWTWDIDRIRAKSYTDNVVEFVVAKLEKLPEEIRRQMTLAACLGYGFESRTLALVGGSTEQETEAALATGVREGLLVRRNGSYLFLHDRIQEAAYSLIPERQRAELDLQIGRRLLAQTPPDLVEDRIFDLISHLNRGAALITEQPERTLVAELNLRAARKAKSSTAYLVAAGYLSRGAALLGENPWEQCYQLSFALFLERAECAFLSGALDEAERLFPLLLQQARNRVDQAAVYRVLIDTRTTAGQDDQAIKEALCCLRLFGIEMSPHPSSAEVELAYQAVWSLLGDRSIEELIDLPLLSDPEMGAAMEILARLYAPAYQSDNNLLFLHVCHAVNLSLRHGNCPASTQAYGWFGVMLCSVYHRFEEGLRFAKLAFDLMERNRFLAYRAKATFVMRIIAFWSQPLDSMLEYSQRTIAAAVETGDVPVACFSYNHAVMGMLLRGDRLSEVQSAAEQALAFVHRAGFSDVHDMITGIERFVQAMRGRTRHLSSYDDERFAEAEFESRLARDRMPTLVFYYYVVKLMARFFSGDYRGALAAGDRSKSLLWAGLFSAQGACFYLYYALALAAAYDTLGAAAQKEALEVLAVHREQLGKWAANFPPTFHNGYALLCAEFARLRGETDEAMRSYEEAIRSAHSHGFVQNEALAFELAAAFYRKRGSALVADTYLRQARQCYLRWGADGKVRQLDERYPQLGAEAARTASEIGRVDALTVLKASQAISGEIVICHLLDTLMRVVIENAGAQKAYLLLAHADELTLEAQGSMDGAQVKVLHPTSDEMPLLLPISIVNYVKRTRECVILDDASNRSRFSGDRYIAEQKPVSILCLPVLRQAKLVGLLYLENNLVQGAFTRDRIPVLEVLAAQAALSLENARTYEALRFSEARYRELHRDIPIMIFTLDPQGTILSVNPFGAHQLGYSVEELEGRPILVVFHEKDHPTVTKQLRMCLQHPSRVYCWQLRKIRKDGSLIWVEETAQAVHALAGAFNVLVVCQDITERRRAEEALRESEQKYRQLSETLEQRITEAVDELRKKDRMLIIQGRQAVMGEMISNISHQWRQPLNILGLLAQELQVTYKLGEFTTDYIDNNVKKTMEIIQHMSKTIDDFRNFFKSEKEKVKFRALEVIEATMSLLEGSLTAVGIKSEVVATDDPAIDGYPNEFAQVLLNIINNARDALLAAKVDSPTIAIRLYSEGGKAVVTISDNAGGIPEGIIDKVFEPYFTTKGPDKGTGIGLYMSKTIIEKNMHGALSVRNVGAGAEFRIEI